MKKFLYLISFIFIYACGFEPVNLSNINNYNISKINVEGEKRINFLIRNKLLNSTPRVDNPVIVIDLITNKNKIIKEKNIKNEITKYEISITTEVNVYLRDKESLHKFTLSNNGIFDVSNQNSITRNNEKKLINLLSEDMAEKIIYRLNKYLNDL